MCKIHKWHRFLLSSKIWHAKTLGKDMVGTCIREAHAATRKKVQYTHACTCHTSLGSHLPSTCRREATVIHDSWLVKEPSTGPNSALLRKTLISGWVFWERFHVCECLLLSRRKNRWLLVVHGSWDAASGHDLRRDDCQIAYAYEFYIGLIKARLAVTRVAIQLSRRCKNSDSTLEILTWGEERSMRSFTICRVCLRPGT
jgi:hypothetical protein